MHDWNRDGRVDAQDSFIDYQVYQEVTKTDSNNVPRRGSSTQPIGCATIIAAFFVFLLLLFFLV